MIDQYPYDVPTELPAAAGNEIEAIMAAGPPPWIREIFAGPSTAAVGPIVWPVDPPSTGTNGSERWNSR